MQVFGLAMDEHTQSPILVLKNEAQDRVLSIWIGAMEAMSISLAINKVAFPRPMTHDLLLSVIAGLDADVVRVEITDMEEGTYFAELVLDGQSGERRVDSRPSDAIALAVRAEAPVFASAAVLEQAGIASGESRYAVLQTEEAEQWNEELEKLSADDFKYKM